MRTLVKIILPFILFLTLVIIGLKQNNDYLKIGGALLLGITISNGLNIISENYRKTFSYVIKSK